MSIKNFLLSTSLLGKLNVIPRGLKLLEYYEDGFKPRSLRNTDSF